MAITVKMKEEDYLAQRRDFISDQHNGFHQSHIEIIKSLFTLSFVSLGFNFGVLGTSADTPDKVLWFVSSLLFVAIIVLCFTLFHLTNSRQTGMMELLQDELDMPHTEYEQKTNKIERYIKLSNRLILLSYTLFFISVVSIFVRVGLQ